MTTTWGMPDERSLPTAPLVLPAVLLCLSALLAGILVTLILGFVAGIVAAVIVAVSAAVWGRGQGRMALHRLGALPADPVRHARLLNIVEGLVAQTSAAAPRVMVIGSDMPNALVTRSGGRPVVAVTSSLLDGLVRTEIEAVVAHCLMRAGSDLTTRASVACAFGPLLASVAPAVGYEDDVRAAAVTRYPPALAKALAKLRPAPARFGPMWMVADDAAHRPDDERIEALSDL